MKILYAIQTTGNGHLSRAQKLVPKFSEKTNVDILTSGPLNNFPTYKPPIKHYKGFKFFTSKSGSINWIQTVFLNNYFQFFIDVFNCPVRDYDIVISDYEPISAWASMLKGIKCVALSNQYVLNSKNVPKPKRYSRLLLRVINFLCPTKLGYGYHYRPYNENILSPIIRDRIREINTSTSNEILIYLPTYSINNIIDIIKKIPDQMEWTIFTNESDSNYKIEGVNINSISDNLFAKKIGSCYGIICAAGFSITSEAIFLGKPMLVVPVKAHIEQQFNAAALEKEGIQVLKEFSLNYIDKINEWIHSPTVLHINYKDNSGEIVKKILATNT